MTMKRLVAVRDVKLQEYLGVSVVKNDVEGQRHFSAILNHRESRIAQHPRDYQLHELGAIDMESGAIVPLEKVRDITPYEDLERFEFLKSQQVAQVEKEKAK